MFRISKDLSLPVDAVTQKFALVGRSGSGKSTTAVDLAEEMLKRGYPIAVIDPTGVWWGLQSSADGKSAGHAVVIFGGSHGHVPLEPTAGKIVADFVVNERVPVVLDLSAFGENEMRRFVAEFTKQLYRTNREALHLFVDEADEFAPQSASGGSAADCHGAMQNIVRRGRVKGIGVTLITQRSAVIDKSVLYQTECLIAMQLTGPLDQAAVDGWIKFHGTKEEREQIMGSLSRLQTGYGWVYSPAWLKKLTKVHFRQAETFDSRQTPRPGEPQRQPKRVADVDLKRLEKQMAATIEATKANDPKELKKRIAELERQIKQGAIDPKAIEVAEARGEQRGRLAAQQELKSLRAAVTEREGRLSKVDGLASKIGQLAHLNGEALSDKLAERPAAPRQVERPKPISRQAAAPVDGISNASQRVLDAIAWWASVDCPQPSRRQVAFAAGYTVNGHFNNLTGQLRSAGLIDYPAGDHLCLTDAGAGAAALPDEPPSLDELHARIRGKLSNAELKLFDALVVARASGEPPLRPEDLAERSGYTVNGHFNNLRGRLRSLGLVDYIGGGTQASDLVFPEALA